MAQAVAYSKTGAKKEATLKLNSDIFGLEPSSELVVQAYRTYLANGRSAQASTLKRGAVAGGGKKPWRQKGTGRARVGSIRVPQWKGGGVVFGPTGHENYTLSMPTRMKRLAVRHALSLRANDKAVSVIDAFDSTDGRVKSTVELLSKLGVQGHIVLVVDKNSDLIVRATRNIEGLEVVTATYLNVYTVMNADHLLLTVPALEALNAWLGEKK
jgi:large subunit ribosomal protein L4